MTRGLREDLNAAFESTDGAEEELAERPQEILDDETQPDSPDSTGTAADADTDDTSAGDGTGDQDKKSEAAKAEGDPSSAGDDPDAAAASDPKKGSDNNSLKAPVGWKPQEREQWSKVPRPLQERIIAREKEMAQAMAGTSEARKTHEYVGKMSEAYGSLAQEAGFSHPLEAAAAALNTMKILSGGSTQEKAREAARIIQQFGVDIQTLDDVLVSSPSSTPADPNMARIDQLLNERLRPVQEFLTSQQRAQQQAEARQAQQANEAVIAFSEKAEFLPDVKDLMADIIEAAAARGVNLTLDDAYARACAADPEISAIIEQRKKDEALKGNQDSLRAKQAAASSVHGRRSGTGGVNQSGSIRDAIRDAWDTAESG